MIAPIAWACPSRGTHPELHHGKDRPLGLHCGVGGLIEDAAHLAVTFRTAVTVVHAGALFVAGTSAPTSCGNRPVRPIGHLSLRERRACLVVSVRVAGRRRRSVGFVRGAIRRRRSGFSGALPVQPGSAAETGDRRIDDITKPARCLVEGLGLRARLRGQLTRRALPDGRRNRPLSNAHDRSLDPVSAHHADRPPPRLARISRVTSYPLRSGIPISMKIKAGS